MPFQISSISLKYIFLYLQSAKFQHVLFMSAIYSNILTFISSKTFNNLTNKGRTYNL